MFINIFEIFVLASRQNTNSRRALGMQATTTHPAYFTEREGLSSEASQGDSLLMHSAIAGVEERIRST